MSLFDVLRYPIDDKKIFTSIEAVPYEILIIWYRRDLNGTMEFPEIKHIFNRFLSSHDSFGLLNQLKKRIAEYDNI